MTISELIHNYDVLTELLNKNIKGLKAHPRILSNDYKYLFPVYEKAMYVALSASDLNIALKHLDVSNSKNNGYEKNYFARNVAHISYELLNHQQKVVGPEVSKLVIEKLGNNGLFEMKTNSKKLAKVITNHYKQLKFIRTSLIGHRTPNGSEMAEGMLSIDEEEIYKIGKEIFYVYLDLHTAYMNLLKKL
jgi:hypothetical protein